MLTVKQAKDMGVVFVEGDEIEAYGVAYNYDWFTNIDFWYGDPVESFAWRDHTGNEIPCDGGFPVVVEFKYGENYGLARHFNWSSKCINPIVKWKPDLDALTKIIELDRKINDITEKTFNSIVDKVPFASIPIKCGREVTQITKEKPMKKYKYERVTGLKYNEIAKAMIDGEVFYTSDSGENHHRWNGHHFIDNDHYLVSVMGEYFRKVEITQKDELAHDIWYFLGDDKLGLAGHLIELGWTKQ